MRFKKSSFFALGLLYDTCCAIILCAGLPIFLFSKKMRRYLSSRKSVQEIIRLVRNAGERPVFLYCSSIGELEQAAPLVQRINEHGIPFFVFVHSQNGLLHAQNISLPQVAITPLDFFFSWRRIFRHCQPRLCIINRHEYWPGFVLNAALRENLHLINTVEKEYRNPAYRIFIHWLRRQCSAIFFVNQPTTPAANSVVTGDTRLDRLRDRAGNEAVSIAALRQRLRQTNKKVLVIGNAYPEDVRILRRAIDLDHRLEDHWQIIVIPARPAMTGEIRSILDIDIPDLIIDGSFGQLFSWYQCADAAWIGGGFGAAGIHNTLEAISGAAMLLSGPNLNQQPDALEACKAGLLHVCKDAEDCLIALKTCELSKQRHIEQQKILSPTELIFDIIFPGHSIPSL